MTPLAIDLFCGLGGWTEGLLAEGYRVVGFDNERHVYGDAKYPAQLVIQDVLTIHGSQFKDAALIVASPPCQEYSYMAMPWSIAKKKAAEYRDGTRDRRQLTALFDACFRIQREAIEATGHFIPLVVENVCGAQKWVGRARWHFGSFYLWGDVPALMPITMKAIKVPTMGAGWYPPGHPKHVPGRSVSIASRATRWRSSSIFRSARCRSSSARAWRSTDTRIATFGRWQRISSGSRKTGERSKMKLTDEDRQMMKKNAHFDPLRQQLRDREKALKEGAERIRRYLSSPAQCSEEKTLELWNP